MVDVRTIALIPARAGSVRVPKKNIRLLGGIPLIAWTILAARAAHIFDEIIVVSDSEEILRIGSEYGADIFWRGDDGTGPDRIWIKELLALNLDYSPGTCYHLLRPTSPFRTLDTFIRASNEFDIRAADSLRAVHRVTEHPYKMWRDIGQGYMKPLCNPDFNLFLQPTQSFGDIIGDVFVQNASYEIFTRRTFETYDNQAGENIIKFETRGYEGFDINTPDDFAYAEYLVESGRVKKCEI